jgi:hypothetical protein
MYADHSCNPNSRVALLYFTLLYRFVTVAITTLEEDQKKKGTAITEIN